MSKGQRHSWSIRTRSGAVQFQMCNLDAKAGRYLHEEIPQHFFETLRKPQSLGFLSLFYLTFYIARWRNCFPQLRDSDLLYLSSCWKDGTSLPSWQGEKPHERTASWNLVETITLNILKRIIISYDCVWEIISKLTFAACLLWGCLGVDLQIEQFVLCFQNCTLHWKYWVWVWFFKRTLWITDCASHGTMPSPGWEKDRIGRYHELFAAVECGHSFHSFRVSWQPWSSESAVPFSDILEIKLQVFSLNCVFSRFDHEGSLSLTGWLAYYHLGPCMHPSGR